MADTKKNTPKIRFKGFEDEWTQRKFCEVAQRQSETSTSNDDNPCVEYEDVIAEQGIMNKDVYSKRVCKKGIRFTSEDVLYGKLRPYLHNWLNPNFSGVAVGDWWVLRPINANKNFLFRLIQTSMYDVVANQSSGSKMPRADWKLISNTDFQIPSSKKEQSKIANVFDDLDTLISNRQKKLESLRNLKKACLVKMFPQNGSKVPEIRFKGFSGDWEEKKLGECANVYDGVHKTPNYTDSGIMFLSVENITTLKSNKFISQKDFDRDYKVYPQKGDVLMTRIGDVGTSNVVETDAKIAFYVSLALLKPQNIESYFLSYSILSPLFKKDLRSKTLLTAIPQKINKNEIGKISFFVPIDSQEQILIGNYFRNLDTLLANKECEIEKLQNLKKACLSKMFV